MATMQPVVKFTYEDYRTAPPDRRYELLDGDLLMVPAPNLKHQKVQFRLGQELGRFILDHELGEFFFAPCDVVLSDTDVVQPDLLFVSREREHLLSGGENVRGAPDLVVEIVSPATADRARGYKRALYGRHGVMEYWLVDPTADTIWIHRQRAGVLAVTPHLRSGTDAALAAARRPGTRPRRRLLVLRAGADRSVARGTTPSDGQGQKNAPAPGGGNHNRNELTGSRL